MTAILITVFLPVFIAGLLFLVRRQALCRGLFLSAGILHLGAAVSLWITGGSLFHGWLNADPAGILFLSTASLLCLGAGVIGLPVLFPRPAGEGKSKRLKAGQMVTPAFFLLFLSSMSAVCLVAHAGLLWVFIEATTLASAPLIYLHKNPRSLEATWKYLLICSVGIALALFGNLLLSISVPPDGEGTTLSLLFSDLIALAPGMETKLLKGAFIFLVVGYGTKMGLAPMHTWLPDAHSEAPGFVSALLSGALLNCAFLGILRFYSVLLAAGETQADFAAGVLKGFGLLSMGLAAVFLCNQKDYKRLLAYSSIEHMGILAFAVGIGGLGAFGALYHGVNHSLVKASLFLSAGTILKVYKTKEAAGVKGMAHRIPGTAVLWGAGFFAATGFPPFGTFFSEFFILREAFSCGNTLSGIFFLLFLTLAFFGIAATVLPMIQGKGEHPRLEKEEPMLSLLIPGLFLFICLILGLWLPEPLADRFTMAASLFGGSK